MSNASRCAQQQTHRVRRARVGIEVGACVSVTVVGSDPESVYRHSAFVIWCSEDSVGLMLVGRAHPTAAPKFGQFLPLPAETGEMSIEKSAAVTDNDLSSRAVVPSSKWKEATDAKTTTYPSTLSDVESFTF